MTLWWWSSNLVFVSEGNRKTGSLEEVTAKRLE
nr:MAG TPA: hypothetical protein [Caudoviricetes sp.]